LETNNIVIVLDVYNQYAPYYQDLINGLNNYRRRGYQIVLNFDYLAQGGQAFDLIARTSTNYISLSARNTGFDLTEGGYYRAIAFDYLNRSKPDHYDLRATN
jgi:hypothetical protein